MCVCVSAQVVGVSYHVAYQNRHVLGYARFCTHPYTDLLTCDARKICYLKDVYIHVCIKQSYCL